MLKKRDLLFFTIMIAFFSVHSEDLRFMELSYPSKYIEKEIHLNPKHPANNKKNRHLIGKIYFHFDSKKLKLESYSRLQSIVNVLNTHLMKNKSNQIFIIGYADKIGKSEYNLKLGLERAEHLAHLLSKKGLLTNKIRIASYGENTPNNEKEKARMAEIFVISTENLINSSVDSDTNALSIVVGLFIIFAFILFIFYYTTYFQRKNR